MKELTWIDLDLKIARARILLSLLALGSIYVDPTTGAGAFSLGRVASIALALHFCYATVLAVMLARTSPWPRLTTAAAAIDVLFAVAVAFATEGPTSPAYVFFAFAIIAVGCRTGFRAMLSVTTASVVLYLVILVLREGVSSAYLMRPAYLGIIGYLFGFLGQERLRFEARIRQLEADAERHEIARSLHDGYVQALAGVNLRLETCRELLARGQSGDARAELTDLQAGVTREYDGVRAFLRRLVDLPSRPHKLSPHPATEFQIRADFRGDGRRVEQILQIMLEGVRNVLRHARARSGLIEVSSDAGTIHVRIADDGVGFASPATPPWSIASRVADSGGSLRIVDDHRPGALVDIELPNV